MNRLFCVVMTSIFFVSCAFYVGNRAMSTVEPNAIKQTLKFSFRIAATTDYESIQSSLEGIDFLAPLLLPSHVRFSEVENLYKSIECDPGNIDMQNNARLSTLTGEWVTLATDLPYMTYVAPLQKLLYLPDTLLFEKAKKEPLMAIITGIMQTVGEIKSTDTSIQYDNYILFEIDSFDCTFAMITLGNCKSSEMQTVGNNRLDVAFTGKSLKVVEGNESELSRLFEYLGDKETIKAYANADFFMKGWSDVVYLDTEANLRVMKGNAGNFYFLKKMKT